jgi:hypothetical protein
MDKISALRAFSPDVIFVEPVGSCTDLSATILQPLKRDFSHEYRLAPLTVLIDPARTADLSDPNIAFLFERQCEEADLVLTNNRTKCLAAPSRSVNALTGEGVSAWLDELLSGALPVGAKLLEIDYQRYAAAEAALGWLNWSAMIQLQTPLSPASLVGPFLDHLQQSLTDSHSQIVHLKIFDQTPSGYLKAALTRNAGEPSVEGDLSASPETAHTVRLNLRAVKDPETLQRIVEESLALLPGKRTDEHLQCFSPSPPKPEYRYSEVVG